MNKKYLDFSDVLLTRKQFTTFLNTQSPLEQAEILSDKLQHKIWIQDYQVYININNEYTPIDIADILCYVSIMTRKLVDQSYRKLGNIYIDPKVLTRSYYDDILEDICYMLAMEEEEEEEEKQQESDDYDDDDLDEEDKIQPKPKPKSKKKTHIANSIDEILQYV